MKRIAPLILIGLGLFATSAQAAEEEKVQFGGYYRNETNWMDLKSNSGLPSWLNSSDMGLRLKAKINDTADFRASTRLIYLPDMPQKFTPTLNELYMGFNLDDRAYLKAGKVRINWGTGMAWNPTDILQPRKNPTDPTRQEEGTSGILFEVPLTFENSEVQGVTLSGMAAFPENRADGRPTYVGRANLLTGSYDLSALVFQDPQRFPKFGLTVSGSLFGEVVAYGEALWQKGTQQVYPISGQLIAAQNDSTWNSQSFTNWLIGTRYTFPANVVGSLEYYHNAEGYGLQSMQDYLTITGGQATALMGQRQNYLLVSAAKADVQEGLGLSLSCIGGLDDGGWIFIPQINYSGFQSSNFYLRSFAFTGNGTEFTLGPQRLVVQGGVQVDF